MSDYGKDLVTLFVQTSLFIKPLKIGGGARALESVAVPAASGELSLALENPGGEGVNLAPGRTHIRSRSPR